MPLPKFGVPLPAAQVAGVALETDEHVDDVLIEFKSGCRALVQAKRRLEFGPTFKKVVAQWIAAAKDDLDPNRDRLVAIAGSGSGAIRDLATALERHRTDIPGNPTSGESSALAKLDGLLNELPEEDRELVRRCAFITLIDLEEEESLGAQQAQHMLAGVVTPDAAPARVWRDLIARCGRVARLRGGYAVEGWVRVLQDEGYTIVAGDSAAASAAAEIEALDSYRAMLRKRGTEIDLRPLGASIPPIPLIDMDSSVNCVPRGGDSRDSESLPWSLLRRRRILLTGLPGGGKSVAVAAAAAVLAEAIAAPLPLVASLRDVDGRDRSVSFLDRLLDSAVRDLPSAHRDLVRSRLEDGLLDGRVAVMLDSLDETHGRRGYVVSEIADLIERVSGEVPVLLATRDVAYSQASSLGWDDMRLVKPSQSDRTVRAVIGAVADARGLNDETSWIDDRASWVKAALERDPVLAETPLLPVLLALQASDRQSAMLPTSRAGVLHAAIEASVRRREANRDPRLQVATLAPSESAAVMLEAFAVEAAALAEEGGHAPLSTITSAVSDLLTKDWGMPRGAASSGAETIAHFWDELGTFVMSGDPPTVTARTELLLDIGDALNAAGRVPPEDQPTWVAARVSDERFEPVILAAALEPSIANELVQSSATSGSTNLLVAAATAVRQGARPLAATLAQLGMALADEAYRPDAEGWYAFELMLRSLPREALPDTLEGTLSRYPENYQIIGRAAICLKAGANGDTYDPLLLEALRIEPLPPLGSRSGVPEDPWSTLRINRLYSDVIADAAMALVGPSDEAARLALALLTKVGRGLQEQLRVLLEAAGFAQEVREVLAEQDEALVAGFGRLADIDTSGPEKLLEHLRTGPRAELSPFEAGSLDELADFFQTLNLNSTAAWPPRERFDQWLEFVDCIRELAGFNPGTLVAEAEITYHRVQTFGHAPFYALDIASSRRKIEAWGEDNTEAARISAVLSSALYQPAGITAVAATAMSQGPAGIIVPALEEALPSMGQNRRHEWIVGHTLAHFRRDPIVREWVDSPSPALRQVAAERLRSRVIPGAVDPDLARLLGDTDLAVVVAALRSIGAEDSPEVRSILELTTSAPRNDWVCTHCGQENPATWTSCSECHIVAPDPSKVAADILKSLVDGSTD
ncbi:HEAT repeat domain-containing protein [Cellulosimicrobium sp. SH8]|uniref:HEAT repeat domain-containing protein n=1 Tax=Cellulosimicrobium sp. SH8 TaxID=2952936 RepID=UPI0021F3BD9E|nr:HEAT repeat domain-containing protein [Cellulosimicrobium sp. SH8]